MNDLRMKTVSELLPELTELTNKAYQKLAKPLPKNPLEYQMDVWEAFHLGRQVGFEFGRMQGWQDKEKLNKEKKEENA